jgi:hypothetical protein
VDHIITALTPPRTYYPPEEAPLLLGPSKGCTEAIKCLEEHIRLLQGNVNREVLEVFEGEVGMRLIGYQARNSFSFLYCELTLSFFVEMQDFTKTNQAPDYFAQRRLPSHC